MDGSTATRNLTCSVDLTFVGDGGVGRDGIPALTDPPMATPGSPALSYLLPRDRVIGLVLDGQPIAIPHNILWWHEIVNLNRIEGQVAVTYCPLTGSSMVFDRAAMVASVEMTWDGWQRLHPNTVAVSGALNSGRNYSLYPYGIGLEPGGEGHRWASIRDPAGTCGTGLRGVLGRLGQLPPPDPGLVRPDARGLTARHQPSCHGSHGATACRIPPLTHPRPHPRCRTPGSRAGSALGPASTPPTGDPRS